LPYAADIATLIKAPVQFSKLSTYNERIEIVNGLSDIESCIDSPYSLGTLLDQLKQSIRPFHIRHTKERLIEFNDELFELVRKKQEFSETLNNLQQDLELTTKNKVETNKVLTLLQEQNSELESNIESGKDRLDALNEKISNIENDEERISEIVSIGLTM
jgi:chromosome segregation ATPase